VNWQSEALWTFFTRMGVRSTPATEAEATSPAPLPPALDPEAHPTLAVLVSTSLTPVRTEVDRRGRRASLGAPTVVPSCMTAFVRYAP
jgi:hypothetical protein